MKLILFFICLVMFLFMGESMAQQNINKLSTKELTINGKVEVNSTTLSSKPCPAMTETQRNAIATPASGSCVYNTSTLQLNVYNGSIWKSAGGGISNWETAFNYAIGDVVIESSKIYQANTAHTSTVFASQLANWTQIANNVTDATGVLPLANGGTNKNATASAGSVVYSDADSFELTTVGTAGQVLKSNGVSAPGFTASSIKAKAENASSVDAEEIQFPNNQLTETAAGKYLSESGNRSILANPGFEHLTTLTSWTSSGTAVNSNETAAPLSGLKSLRVTATAQTIQVFQDSVLYASVLANTQGVIRFSASNTAAGVTACQRAAGVKLTGANNCVTLATNGVKKVYELPVVLSATSNGVEISAASTTGVTILDDFELSDSLSLPEVAQAQLVGQSYWTSADNCIVTRATNSFGPMTDDADCAAPVVDFSNLGTWLTTDANNIEQTVNNLPPGTYISEFYVPSTLSIVSTARLKVFDGAECTESTTFETFGAYAATWIRCTHVYTSSVSKTFELYGLMSSGTLSVGALSVARAYFRLYYYPPASKIYSQRCVSAVDCENDFSAKISSADAVSDENLDWINGNCTDATTGEQTCTFNSGIFTVAPNCIATVFDAGAVTPRVVHINALSSTAITLSNFATTGLTANNQPVNLFCQKQSIDFKEKSQITGTFKEVMTVPGVSKPKTCYLTFGGAGSLGSPTACTGSPCVEYADNCAAVASAPTRSGTGQYSFSFADGTWANSTFLDCKGSSRTAGAGSLVRLFWPTQTTAAGGAAISPNTVIGAIDTDSTVSITCLGQAP